MKILIYILMVCAAGLVVFNLTKLDFDHLLEGDSSIAAVGILAGMCAILALGILLISKMIAWKVKK
ncbi:hypothetical protein QRD02_02575 [Aequorivita sp. SDUM287046]|uniref:DUF3955 domain-containing protein n=1 Tax=Aequorivita aurantiaca TaxID=3053356 RepID=A0ABT8DFA4_9FLAO|nr:hypothetical protein [Aequorivita aurantiaca]MDN3723254.1 hypothetical protein [Aequorivita aurantiaca]